MGWKGDWLNYLINNVKVKNCRRVNCNYITLNEKGWGYCELKKEWIYRIKCEKWGKVE